MQPSVSELRERLDVLGAQLEVYLPGWKLKPPDKEDCNRDRISFTKDQMRFGVSFNWAGGDKSKLKISTLEWPKYSRMERGERRNETISPNRLYDAKESSPFIICSYARGAEAIAKDICRRFLPDYERIYARCKERAEAYQAHEDKSRTQWEGVCAQLKLDASHNWHCISVAGDLNVSITNNNGSLKMDFYCPADKVKAVIDVLKGRNL